MIDGKSSIGRIFDANKFRIWLMIALVLLSSVGFAFPPLAAIICMSVWNVTFMRQFMMYCLLNRVKQETLVNANKAYKAYVYQLESDFKDSGIFFERSVLFTCHMSLTIFMCFFIFDMVGDTNGRIAGSIAVIVFFITITITSAMLLYRKDMLTKILSTLSVKHQQSFNSEHSSEQNNELVIENPMNL